METFRKICWTLPAQALAVFTFVTMAMMPGFARAISQDGLKEIIVEEARLTAVPASLALAVAKVESGFNPAKKSADGAVGVMQIVPPLAEDRGISTDLLRRPRVNVRVGLGVLDRLLERTDGDWREALRAYASIRPTRDRRETAKFVRNVMKWERTYAERLAVLDAVEGRRRDVLMGHDDWGSHETASRAEKELRPMQSDNGRGNEVDVGTMDDGWGSYDDSFEDDGSYAHEYEEYDMILPHDPPPLPRITRLGPPPGAEDFPPLPRITRMGPSPGGMSDMDFAPPPVMRGGHRPPWFDRRGGRGRFAERPLTRREMRRFRRFMRRVARRMGR